MSDNKGSNSVLKLIGNKLFITLLVFAISIILISAAFTRNAQKVSKEFVDEIEQNVKEVADYVPEEPVDNTVAVEDVFQETEYEEVTAEKVFYKMPIAGKLQKEFSVDELLWDETMQDWRTHCGLDIEAEHGAEVDAAAPGTVVDVTENETYGVTVKVMHKDGILTVYKNLDKAVVKKDDELDEGQMIGTVGNSGSFEISQKPHLHFEVISEEKYINPLEFIK